MSMRRISSGDVVTAALRAVALAASLATLRPDATLAEDAGPDRGRRRYIYSLHPDGSHHYNMGTDRNGPGIIVLDIDRGCTWVRCIPLPCLAQGIGGHGGRGIIGHTATRRIYYTFMLSNERTGKGNHGVVGGLDVETDRVLWETYLDEIPEVKGHRLGAGNPAVTPDGKRLYVPPEWTGGKETTVLDASNGKWIAFVPTGGNGCGNAMISPDGHYVYASGGWMKISAKTDTPVSDPATGKPLAFPRSSHFIIDATGERMYLTCDGAKTHGGGGVPAVICSTATGEVLAVPRVPRTPPLDYFLYSHLSHEGSFTPCGRRFWTQAMAWKPAPPPDLFQHPQVVDNPGPGSIKWVSEWDITADPPSLVRMIATRSPGHSHAHALVTREGDLLLTGNGYALDTETGKIKHAWKDKDGKWFQGTKFMQVNFRDGHAHWVGQRHGTGWLYKVPALSEGKKGLD
jgi:hypothetical protein